MSDRYKYKLLYYLRRLTVNDYEIAMKWLPVQCGVKRETFRKWLYIPSRSGQEIPGTALVKCSVFFQVSVIDLFSSPIDAGALVENWNSVTQKTEKNADNQEN